MALTLVVVSAIHSSWPAMGMVLSYDLDVFGEVNLSLGSFDVPIGSCSSCDLRKLECLPDVSCMEQVLSKEPATVAEGIALRAAMRKQMDWDIGTTEPVFQRVPVGKTTQYGNIDAWRQWMNGEHLREWYDGTSYVYVNERKYNFCTEQRLAGKPCFLQKFTADENFGEVEKLATSSASSGESLWAKYEETRKSVADPRKSQTKLPADWYLKSYAHILRLRFNLQPSIEGAYNNRLKEVNAGKGELRVSLHIRRSDSCGALAAEGARATKKSPIDSPPQMTSVRQCYDTKVYLDELVRISELYRKPLVVYLSTDDGTAVIEEIKSNHTDVYEAHTWKYLDYDDSTFEGYNIIEEVSEDGGQAGLVGESSFNDIWHLSHGEVYVGHMGSRFTKVGYALAVARHNTVIPYVSIDGHSLCCEIDEQCADATAKMKGMMDCLAFAHELDGGVQEGDYWSVGSTARESYGLMAMRHFRPSHYYPEW